MSTPSLHEADETASTLRLLGAATMGESGGVPMAPRIVPVWHGARLAAPAYTVQCSAGDNLALHVALVNAPSGSVLVAEVGGEAAFGYWGEVLTTGARARGIRGLVIDGGVRDADSFERQAFPVFSTMVALRGATKILPGSVGVTVTVGDVEVASGDWIVGDRDGVTVVPGNTVGEAIAAGRAREAKEQRLFEELRNGKNTVELLGLDPTPIATD